VQVADNESNPEESTGGLCRQIAAMVPVTSNSDKQCIQMIPASKPIKAQDDAKQKTFKYILKHFKLRSV
jgi:hypothetical protein